MTMQTIESDDLSLGKLFSDFYVVPSYQREYVWDAEKQVDRLLQDISAEYSSNNHGIDSEYFIGSTVVCSSEDGTFEVIDGQQRMTTAFLVLCAIRDYLTELEAPEIDELNQIIASATVNRKGEDEYRYRVALQYEDSHDILERIGKQEKDIGNASKTTRSIENIIEAYKAVLGFLRNEFSNDPTAVRAFYAYFTKCVKLIRVRTVSVAHALKVFETVNDRGVSLDSMDLLKNLLFRETEREAFDRLNDVWKDLADTLYRVGEKPLRFLRYFIFATYTVDRLREDGIYRWFVSNADLCGYKRDPLQFAQRLLAAAKTYANFVQGCDPNGNPNRYISNISHLSYSAHQHFILLLAARNLPPDQFTELCRHVENLFFAYIIARESTREFERSFALWAPVLREVRDGEGLKAFIEKQIAPAKQNLSLRFTQNLRQFREHDTPRYRLRYILAKITQYIDDSAWSTTSTLNTYLISEIDVEHILPQNPGEEVRQSFGQPDDVRERLTRRLGNLTLLEKSIDSSIGNGLFQRKQPSYTQSKFLVTKSLGGKLSVGDNTQYNRAVAPLLEFENWTHESIEARQKMLIELAHKVWDMPIPEEPTQ